jgi:MFS family permease
MQSFGFFLPSLWIPTFATDYSFPEVAGPLALALYNVSAFIGTIAQGWLVDQYHVRIDLAFATVLSMVSVFLFWGFATIQPIFYLFAILWGVSGGAYNATWAGYAFDLQAEGFDVDTTFLIALMVTAKGVASITSGPLSEVLYGVDLGRGAGFAYGGPYAAMIIYTGLCSLLGGVACLRPRKWRLSCG